MFIPCSTRGTRFLEAFIVTSTLLKIPSKTRRTMILSWTFLLDTFASVRILSFSRRAAYFTRTWTSLLTPFLLRIIAWAYPSTLTCTNRIASPGHQSIFLSAFAARGTFTTTSLSIIGCEGLTSTVITVCFVLTEDKGNSVWREVYATSYFNDEFIATSTFEVWLSKTDSMNCWEGISPCLQVVLIERTEDKTSRHYLQDYLTMRAVRSEGEPIGNHIQWMY